MKLLSILALFSDPSSPFFEAEKDYSLYAYLTFECSFECFCCVPPKSITLDTVSLIHEERFNTNVEHSLALPKRNETVVCKSMHGSIIGQSGPAILTKYGK